VASRSSSSSVLAGRTGTRAFRGKVDALAQGTLPKQIGHIDNYMDFVLSLRGTSLKSDICHLADGTQSDLPGPFM